MPRTLFHPVQLLISQDDDHHCKLPFDRIEGHISELLSPLALSLFDELKGISNTSMPIASASQVQSKYPLVALLHHFDCSRNGALLPHTVAMFETLAGQQRQGILSKSLLVKIVKNASALMKRNIFMEPGLAVEKFKTGALESLADHLFSEDRFPDVHLRAELRQTYLELGPFMERSPVNQRSDSVSGVQGSEKKGLLFGLPHLASEYGRDAIPFELARSGIQSALTYVPTSTHQKLVAQCWLLSKLLMRPFEDVFRVRLQHLPAGNLLRIKVDEYGLCWVTLAHPEFLKLDADFKSDSMEGVLVAQLPKFGWSDVELSVHRPLLMSTGLAAAQKTALSAMSRLLKDAHPNYVTDRSIRECAIQRLMINSQDPALAQILTGDRLGISESMLSYRGFSLQQLHEDWWSTIEQITGLSVAVELPGPLPPLGAPKAVSSLLTVPEITAEANSLLKAADNSVSLSVKYHYLIHGTLIRLYLETALRVTKETRRISRSQMSVANGLVMAGDKKVHASSLERAAAVSVDLCRRICEIADLQKRLLQRAIKKRDKQILKAAINGTGPFFAPLMEQRRLLTGSVHLKALSDSRNLHRHFFSTHMARLVAPHLVELQLGHLNGAPLSGPEGTLSPSELQRTLSPHLERTFAQVPSFYPISGRISDRGTWDSLRRKSKSYRQEALESLLKPSDDDFENPFDLERVSKRPQAIAVAMDALLTERLSAGESNAPLIRQAIYCVAKHCDFDDRTVHEACYRLFQRLSRRFENQGVDRMGLWSLLNQGTATLINASHLAASDTILALRSELDPRLMDWEEIERSLPVLLMLFSDCPTLDTAFELLSNKQSFRKLDSDEFATVERPDEHGAELFYLRGPALSVYSLWCARNGRVPERSEAIESISKFGMDTGYLEELCYAEKLLVHPEAVAKVLSGRSPYREADWDQDIRWRFNIASSNTATVKASLHTASERPAEVSQPKKSNPALRQLQKAIDASNNCPDRLRSELEKLGKLQPGDETFRLLAEWCVKLFQPGSNLRSPNSKHGLARSTVKAYVSFVGRLIYAIENEVGEPITEIPPENLAELVEEIVENSDEFNGDPRQLAVLQRFFASSELPVPSFNVVPGEGAPPRAVLIPDVTVNRAVDSINELKRRTDLNANAKAIVDEAERLCLAMSESGARTNELKYLESRHVCGTEETVVIVIRPSSCRSLKTKSSQRSIRISSDLISNEGFPLLISANGAPLFESLISVSLSLHFTRVVRKYDLRHRFANKEFEKAMAHTDAYRRALALRELSLQMGHHGLQTTLTYYVHRVRAHTHDRYESVLDSDGDWSTLNNIEQRYAKARETWPCFFNPETKVPSAPRGRPPKLNQLMPKVSNSLRKIQLFDFLDLLNQRVPPRFAAMHLGIDGNYCLAIARWIEQHIDLCPIGIRWVNANFVLEEWSAYEGRRSAWRKRTASRERGALRSECIPSFLLYELKTALGNQSIHLNIKDSTHARAIGRALSFSGTTIRLFENERNANRFDLSIAGSAPRDGADRVVLRMAVLTQVIYSELQPSKRFEASNPYLRLEGDS